MKQQRSKENGRFLAVYDWDKVIPEICRQYTAGKPIHDILAQDGMPDWSTFWNKLQSNPDYMAQYDVAGHGKAAFFDGRFDEIDADAKEAFRDKSLNPNALKVRLDNLKHHRGHLNPKYRDRKVEHVHEIGVSMREELTKARQRLEARILPVIEGEIIRE